MSPDLRVSKPAQQAGQAECGPPVLFPSPVPAPRHLPPAFCFPPTLPHRDTIHFRVRMKDPQMQPPTGRILVKAWLPMRLGEVLESRRRNSPIRQLETDLITRLHRPS